MLPTKRPREKQVAGALLLLLLAVLAWRTVTDLDFGIHMASGRFILDTGSVPDRDPFTYTVGDHPYLAYHWLFQVALYWLHSTFGVVAVSLWRWLVVVGTFFLLADIVRGRPATSALAFSVCGAAAILASEWRFALRPELLSYLLVAATLWVLERRRQGRTAPLWLLPLIQLVWVNTHIYVFGWAVMLAYLAEEWIRARRLPRQLLLWLGVSAAAVFVNPYHYKAVLYPLTLATRMQAENVFAQNITELASPFRLSDDPRFPFRMTLQFGSYKLLLGLGAAAALLHLRRGRWLDALLLAVFGVLSALAVRNMVLYAVVAVPLAASALDDLRGRFSKRATLGAPPSRGKPGTKERRDRKRRPESFSAAGEPAASAAASLPRFAGTRGVLLVCVLAFVAITALRVLTGGYYVAGRRDERFAAGVAPRPLAVPAAAWLARANLAGPGFNNLNIGATLLWLDPRHKVFIDGRNEVTGEEFFTAYLEASDPERWEETAKRYGFEYAVLAHRSAMPLARALAAREDWKLVFADGSGVVFVRADGPNGSIPEAVLPAAVDEETRWRKLGAVAVSAGGRESLRRWLWPDEPAPGEAFYFGTFLLTLGRWASAEGPLLDAAVASPSFYETSFNLGALYYRLKAWEAAMTCYLNGLMLEPRNELARSRLGEAETNFRAQYGLVQ